MSDVTQSPDTTPLQQSLPLGLSEVPVNEAPVSAPTPLGPQAPEKTPEMLQQERAVSRRESIEKAFKRAESEKPIGERKRGMGDNNPPEPMAKEAQPKPKDAQPVERPRGERGQFAPRQPDPAQQQQPQPGEPAKQYPRLHEQAPYREPPARFAGDARAAADWHGVPESVRGAVHRSMKEMEQGIQHYRPAAEEFSKISHFHDLAKQYGTDLPTALTNYVSMEQKLRSDLVGGLDIIVQNLGLHANGQPITLKDVAYHIINMTPEQHKMTQQSNQSAAIQMQMGQLHQQQQALAQAQQQMQYERHLGKTLSDVDRFADTHPRFDELADAIKQELQFGYSLEDAYARADRLYPATGRAGGTQAAQTRTHTAQTRSADKSISGAPDAGLSDRPNGKAPPTRREAIAKAFRRAGTSL